MSLTAEATMSPANRSLTIDIPATRAISYLAQLIVECDQVGTEDDLDLPGPLLCLQQSDGHRHDVCEFLGNFPLVRVVKYVAAPVIEIAGIGQRRGGHAIFRQETRKTAGHEIASCS